MAHDKHPKVRTRSIVSKLRTAACNFSSKDLKVEFLAPHLIAPAKHSAKGFFGVASCLLQTHPWPSQSEGYFLPCEKQQTHLPIYPPFSCILTLFQPTSYSLECFRSTTRKNNGLHPLKAASDCCLRHPMLIQSKTRIKLALGSCFDSFTVGKGNFDRRMEQAWPWPNVSFD